MSWKKKILNTVNVFISFIFLSANYTFATPLLKDKLAATSQVADVAKSMRKFSHLVRKAEEGESEDFIYGMKIRGEQQWIPPDGKVINNGVKAHYEHHLKQAQKSIERLEHIYGKGITVLVDRILIVSNLAGEMYGEGMAPLASYEDGVLKIDILLFNQNRFIVFEELEHEFLESIIGEDVVATYRNVLRFLEPNKGVTEDELYRWDEREYQEGILASLVPPIDPDAEYTALLYRLYELQRTGRLQENEIIASVVRYILKTKSYEKIRDQLGLPHELAQRIRGLDPKLDDALLVFNELTKEREGVDLVEKIKAKDLTVMHAVKTLNGIRVTGLDNLNENLDRLIRAEARQVSNADRLSGKLVKQDNVKYILVNEERIGELETAIGKDEYGKIVVKLRENNYEIWTKRPDTDDKNIINLVDPEDHKRINQADRMFYLLMPYTRSSLYIAALVLQADGNWEKLDPLVKQLILDLYPGLEPEDLSDFFTKPWELLPKIQPVIENIENLRKAIAIIEQAA